MATDYFTDAQSLTRTPQFTESPQNAASVTVPPPHSNASTELRLTQFLAGLSISLGLAQLFAPRAIARVIGIGEQATLMRLVGARELACGLGLLSRRQPARWSWLRVAGDAIDLALLGKAATTTRGDLARISAAAAAVAAVAAADLYAARRLRGISSLPEQPVVVRQTVVVNSDPASVYAFWSHLENLPRFMRHLQQVTRRDDRVSHWVAHAPVGTRVEWDAEIVADEPNRQLGWRTLPGSQVEHEGVVMFEPMAGGRGTQLRVVLRYVPPLGPGAVPLARLLGEEPQVQINEDLRRFKQLIETGEVASTLGQPSGRRSALGRITLGRWLS